MIKFTESDLDSYQKVRDVLERFAGSADTVIRERLRNLHGMAHSVSCDAREAKNYHRNIVPTSLPDVRIDGEIELSPEEQG